MSDPQRREFLAAAGMASLATLGGAQPAAGGDPSFMNNVPDPTLAGKELPTFKFELEKSVGKVIGGSVGRGSDRRATPDIQGNRRCLHELNRASCAKSTGTPPPPNGRSFSRPRRTTVIHSAAAETKDFEPGDIWYFPRGHGHCSVASATNNALYPDLRQRLLLRVRHVQHHRLDRPHPSVAAGQKFGVPKATFANFPKEEVYFAAARPRRPSQKPTFKAAKKPPQTRSSAWSAQPSPIPHNEGGRERPRGIHERFPISTSPSRVSRFFWTPVLGGLRLTLHWHPTSDEWQYVIEGQVSVTMVRAPTNASAAETLPIRPCSGFIPLGGLRRLESTQSENVTARILIGFLQHRLVTKQSTCRNGSRQIPRTCSPPISASRRKCLKNSRIATCSSPARMEPDRRGPPGAH